MGFDEPALQASAEELLRDALAVDGDGGVDLDALRRSARCACASAANCVQFGTDFPSTPAVASSSIPAVCAGVATYRRAAHTRSFCSHRPRTG